MRLFTITLLMLFLLWLCPDIDIFVSSLFYSKESNFFWVHSTLPALLYQSVDFLGYALLTLIGCAFVYQLIPGKRIKLFPKKALIYIVLTFVVGSGLIVNDTLKNNFGRARPRNIEIFGGEKSFTAPAVVAKQCNVNCSFSCGHCSFAFGFFALFFLFRKRWIFFTVLLYGVAVSMTRIVQGGHFFSDAVYSAVIMFAVARSLYFLMYELKLSSDIHIAENTNTEKSE